MNKSAEHLARLWIELWNEGKPDDIPLAEDFVHTSPFGVMSGKTQYLETVKPLAAENVTELTIKSILSNDKEAAIRFTMKSPNGPIEVVDWVSVENGLIIAITSFYDPSKLPNQEGY